MIRPCTADCIPSPGAGHGDAMVVVLTEKVFDAHLAGGREDRAGRVVAGRAGLDLPLPMEALRAGLGMRQLLLKGEGVLNGSCLRAGLADELSHTIVDGGDPHVGPPLLRRLTLTEHSLLEGGVL